MTDHLMQVWALRVGDHRSRPGTRVAQAAGLAADAVAGHYAAYLVELALPDYGMLKYSNSMVAVAAVQLTNRCAFPAHHYSMINPQGQARPQPLHQQLINRQQSADPAI